MEGWFVVKLRRVIPMGPLARPTSITKLLIPFEWRPSLQHSYGLNKLTQEQPRNHPKLLALNLLKPSLDRSN